MHNAPRMQPEAILGAPNMHACPNLIWSNGQASKVVSLSHGEKISIFGCGKYHNVAGPIACQCLIPHACSNYGAFHSMESMGRTSQMHNVQPPCLNFINL